MTLSLDEIAENKQIEEELLNYEDAIEDLKRQIREDNGLINLHSGLNVPGKDKLSLAAINIGANFLTPEQRSNFRHGNFLVGNLVEVPPAAMCDKFFTYRTEDTQLTEWFQPEIEKVCPFFKEALEMSREQGGAGIILYIEDGASDLDRPVDRENILTIKGYNVLSSEDLTVEKWNEDIGSVKYREPEFYKIAGIASNRIVHESRILKFHGRKVYKKLMVENHGWGYSVIDRAIKKIINLDQSSDAVATSIQNFNQTVLFIKDLAKKIAIPGKREQIKEHIRVIALLQSVLGILALDAEHERYEIHSRNYSGLDMMLEHLVQMASGACDIPSTILLNRAATAGNNKGGVSSNSGFQGRKEWADYISAKQKFDMMPQAIEWVELQELRKDNPAKGRPPEKRILENPPIFEITATEKAQITEQESRAHSAYLDRGVIFPEELRLAIAKGIPIESAIDLNRPQKPSSIPENPQNQNGNGFVQPIL